MFSKLKMFCAVALGVYFLGLVGSLTWSSYQLKLAADKFDEATQDVVVNGATTNAIDQLVIRSERNELQTNISLSRLEALEEEVNNRPVIPVSFPAPQPATIIRETRVEIREKKETPNEIVSKDTSITVASRAINELWLDYCQKFPDESDCRERQVKSSQL